MRSIPVSILRCTRATTPRSRAASSICRSLSIGEAVTQKDGDLVPKDPTHDEDRRCYARAAKRDRLLEEGDAERRRAEPNQVARDVDETMAIRVGLEDRHDRGRRDGAPDRAVVLG